ncbi:MAG: serine hydrolase domain-containing protein [Bryobacteraceae bacterium]
MRPLILTMLLAARFAHATSPLAQVDALFEPHNHTTTPGCATGVAQDGKTLHAKGYGVADLEHDVPITAKSAFYLASASKQFTAMAVHLLVAHGRLSLDEPVRKYIPGLPAYTGSITIRQLLYHTSGLRDYIAILEVAGAPEPFSLTTNDFLAILTRQKRLNFEPGAGFLYSNSGYALLPIVLQGITAEPLRTFANVHIFEPLGMKDTRYYDDRGRILKNRAIGYSRNGAEWRIDAPPHAMMGDGGVYSSVDDLLLWARNFDAAKVGGRKVIDLMTAQGSLNGGRKIPYGAGMTVESYRGLRTLSHTGWLGGYRASFLMLPDQKFTTVTLCNSGTADAIALNYQIAEIFHGASMQKAGGEGLKVSGADVKRRSGVFRSATTGQIVRVDGRDGRLVMLDLFRAYPLEPVTSLRFRYTDARQPFELTYESSFAAIEIAWHGEDVDRFEPAKLAEVSAADLAPLAGSYFSEEAQARFEIAATPGGLTWQRKGWAPARLQPTVQDEFVQGPVHLRLVRDASGAVTGFDLTAGRARNLRFVRESPRP